MFAADNRQGDAPGVGGAPRLDTDEAAPLNWERGGPRPMMLNGIAGPRPPPAEDARPEGAPLALPPATEGVSSSSSSKILLESVQMKIKLYIYICIYKYVYVCYTAHIYIYIYIFLYYILYSYMVICLYGYNAML